MPKKKTHEEFVLEFKEKAGNEYTVLSEYKGMRSYVLIKHILCGHEYMVQPNNFMRGSRCAKCANNLKKTHEEFVLDMKEKCGSEYELLSKYESARKNILVKHVPCGHEYMVQPYNLLRGNGCAKCAKNVNKTHEAFSEQVKVLGSGDYQTVTEYKSRRTSITMEHITCGHQYDVKPSEFLRGRRCPKCNSSKGELMVESVLREMNVSFVSQLKFSECKNIRILSFDFGVQDKDGNIVFLIEYDGKQHFEENHFFGGRKEFIQRVRNDRIKSNFSKAQGIPLLRISYKQENQEEFLKHALEGFFSIRKKNRKTA